MEAVPQGSSVAVTGAGGFIGKHVLQALLERGYRPVAILRPSARLTPELDRVVVRHADVTNLRALAEATEGADAIIHLAGLVSTSARDRGDLIRVNVAGAKNALQVTRRGGVKRLVFMSTTSAVGALQENTPELALNENSPFNIDETGVDYITAKRVAHKLALSDRAAGLPVTVLSPSFVVGPGDSLRNSTQLIDLVARGQLPVVPHGGINPIDVRDVANAVVATLGHHDPAEHYILAGRQNINLSKFVEQVASVTGASAPRWRLPFALTLAAARAAETIFPHTGVTASAVRLSRYYWYFDNCRACRDLGLAPRPFGQSIVDTLNWLVSGRHAGSSSRAA
ncbi:NAD-dependent epimerase/dehydratase family protein [Kordiimonas sp.]|uniref:NAD-dependent epimerase/dehydratase family protein n=1 Tax=Kordiimonas sp. TaxID=1970157 RepID=UPI003A8F7D5E